MVGAGGVAGAAGASSGIAGSGGTGGVARFIWLSSGISMDSNGAIGSGPWVTTSTFGAGNGPTGSPSSPVSPSGTDDGAATGSEKTGSSLVLFVILSIAFCRSSLSTDSTD